MGAELAVADGGDVDEVECTGVGVARTRGRRSHRATHTNSTHAATHFNSYN